MAKNETQSLEKTEEVVGAVDIRSSLVAEIGHTPQHCRYVDSKFPSKPEQIGPFLDEFAPTQAKRTEWEKQLIEAVK